MKTLHCPNVCFCVGMLVCLYAWVSWFLPKVSWDRLPLIHDCTAHGNPTACERPIQGIMSSPYLLIYPAELLIVTASCSSARDLSIPHKWVFEKGCGWPFMFLQETAMFWVFLVSYLWPTYKHAYLHKLSILPQATEVIFPGSEVSVKLWPLALMLNPASLLSFLPTHLSPHLPHTNTLSLLSALPTLVVWKWRSDFLIFTCDQLFCSTARRLVSEEAH